MDLVLSPGVIRSLAANPAVTKEFPFLLPYGKKTATCCGGSIYPATGPAVAAILGLPPDRRARFKTVTGAETVSGSVVRAARLVKESF